MMEKPNNNPQISNRSVKSETYTHRLPADSSDSTSLFEAVKLSFSQRSKKVRIVLASILGIFIIATTICGWGIYQIYRIERFPFAYPQADNSSRKVWLIVGSDSRKHGHLKNTGQYVGERADLIYVARRQGDKLIVASIPRDIDVDYRGTSNRLTLMLWVGPLRLEESLCNDLQVPVGHMLIGTMDTVSELVDSLGGVSVEIPHPYRDKDAGVDLSAGRHLLDGDQTIAYVRSRQPEFLINGKWEAKDLVSGAESRITHSQYVLKDLREKLENTYNPFTWMKLVNGVSSTIRLDEMSSIADLKELMSGKIEMTTIDVEPISGDKLHYRLTPKGIKQLEDLGFRQKCKMYSSSFGR